MIFNDYKSYHIETNSSYKTIKNEQEQQLKMTSESRNYYLLSYNLIIRECLYDISVTLELS